jgi:hypothetical protein
VGDTQSGVGAGECGIKEAHTTPQSTPPSEDEAFVWRWRTQLAAWEDVRGSRCGVEVEVRWRVLTPAKNSLPVRVEPT